MLTMLTTTVGSLSPSLRHKVQIERSQLACDIVPPNSKQNALICTNKQQHQIFSIVPLLEACATDVKGPPTHNTVQWNMILLDRWVMWAGSLKQLHFHTKTESFCLMLIFFSRPFLSTTIRCVLS